MINVMCFDPCAARGTVEKIMRQPFSIEYKLDGVRGLLACTEQNGITLTGRRTSDITGQKLNKLSSVPHFIPVIDAIRTMWPGDTIIDGELCYVGGNSNDAVKVMGSHAEKAREKQRGVGLIDYVAFDIIMLNGEDLRGKSYTLRREMLEAVNAFVHGKSITKHFNLVPQLMKIATTQEHVNEAFERAIEQNYEGLILKRLNGHYHHLEWAKVKASATFDFIITGYELSDSETFAGNGIAALKLGLYDDLGVLHFCTDCSGMTHELRREFYENPEKYRGRVVEIKAQQMFKDTGAVRHPRFVKFRDDLDAGTQTFAKYGIMR